MSTDENRRFAFGANKHGGVGCPAVQAGCNPDETPLQWVVEAFDQAASHEADAIEGTLNEETARRLWLNEIDHYDDKGHSEHAEAAREAARELGWL